MSTNNTGKLASGSLNRGAVGPMVRIETLEERTLFSAINVDQVNALRSTLGSVNGTQNRGAVYIQLAEIYQAAGAPSSAVNQLIEQAQITTYGGQWGGAAILANAYARQQAGYNADGTPKYDIPLDTFSYQIVSRLLDATALNISNGGEGILTAAEIRDLDFSVWSEKGIGYLFPGNVFRELDNLPVVGSPIPPDSVVYSYVSKSDLVIDSASLNFQIGVAPLLSHATEMGKTLSDFGIVGDPRYVDGNSITSANGQFTATWDPNLSVNIVKDNSNGVTATVINPNAMTISAASTFWSMASNYIFAEASANGDDSGAAQISAMNTTTLSLFDPKTGDPTTLVLSPSQPISAFNRDLIWDSNGVGLDADSPRRQETTGSYLGVPNLSHMTVCNIEGITIGLQMNADGSGDELQVTPSGDFATTLSSGGDTATTVSSDSKSVTSYANLAPGVESQTKVYGGSDGSGGLQSIQTRDTNGDFDDESIDPGTGNPAQDFSVQALGNISLVTFNPQTLDPEFRIAFNSAGQVTQSTVDPNITTPQFIDATASALASQVIAKFLSQHNIALSTVATTFSSTSISTLLGVANNATQQAFESFTASQQFMASYAVELANAAAGLAGSIVGTDLFKALGLPTQVGSVVGSALSQQGVDAIINDIDITTQANTLNTALGGATASSGALSLTNVATSIANAGATAIGDYLGDGLGNLIIGSPTEGSTFGGAVGGAIGTGLVAEGLLNGVLDPVLGPVGVLIGSSLGSFLGTLIGDIFGPGKSVGPNASAQVSFDSPSGTWSAIDAAEDNGGNPAIAQSLASAVATELQSIYNSIGGQFTNTDAILSCGMGYFAERGFFSYFLPSPGAVYFSTPTAAIDNAVLNILRASPIDGGNPFMEYALAHSNATTVAGLISDLNAAHDYGAYLANPVLFDLNLAASGSTSQINAWVSEMSQAQALGLINAPGASDLTDGVLSDTQAYVDANSEIINDMIDANDITSINLTNVSAAAAANALSEDNVDSVSINDSAANVQTNLDTLESLALQGQVTSITLTDTTPVLALTQSQASADDDALQQISNPYDLNIIGVSAADAASVADQYNPSQISISDSTANVLANLDTLEDVVSSGTSLSITLTDTSAPILPLTIDQYTSDADVLNSIESPFTVSINDTANNVAWSLDALEASAAANQLGSITLTDTPAPTLWLTAAQYTSDAAAIRKISSVYYISVSNVTAAGAASIAAGQRVVSIGVVDSAANVVGNLSALESIASGPKLGSITLTDSATPTLTLTAAQASADSAALANIGNAYFERVTGASIANAKHLVAQPKVISFTISDTAANIATNIATLQTWASENKLTGISLSGSSRMLTLTAAQQAGEAAALKKITAPYNLTINNKNGTSQVVLNTGLANGVSSELEDYTRANATGTLKDIVLNWTNGGSELELFTGLPAGIVEELKKYSKANATGTLLSTQLIHR